MERSNVIDLTRIREQREARYTDEELDILSRLSSTHPAGKKSVHAELHDRPNLMAKVIQEQLEKNGYPKDVTSTVPNYLVQLQHDKNSNFAPSELSGMLEDTYKEMMQVTYEENLRRSEAAAASEKQNLTTQLGGASLKLVHSTNTIPTNATPRSRNHLHVVNDET